jgi:hypothetical protein
VPLTPCRVCGTEIETGSKFCSECGTRAPAPPEEGLVLQHGPPRDAAGDSIARYAAAAAGVVLLGLIGYAALGANQTERTEAAAAETRAAEAAQKRSADSARIVNLLISGDTLSASSLVRLDAEIHGGGMEVEHTAMHARAADAAMDSAASLLRGNPVRAQIETARGLLQRIDPPIAPAQSQRKLTLQTRAREGSEALDAEARAAQEADRLARKWSYSTEPDQMTGGTTRAATIRSENTVNFDFPYQGPQSGRLTLRRHPQYGREVFLRIEQGQFLCRSYEDCTVRVRFDDGPLERWAGLGPSDGTSTVIFIRNYDRFVQRLRQSETVRIQAEVYQEGAPFFEFQVGGFDFERHRH